MAIHVDIEAFEGGFQLSDSGFGGADASIVSGPDELRNNRGGQNAKNNHDHHDFDQRERCAAILIQLNSHIGSLAQWIARLILKIGSRGAMSIKPTSAPTLRINIGARKDTWRLV